MSSYEDTLDRAAYFVERNTIDFFVRWVREVMNKHPEITQDNLGQVFFGDEYAHAKKYSDYDDMDRMDDNAYQFYMGYRYPEHHHIKNFTEFFDEPECMVVVALMAVHHDRTVVLVGHDAQSMGWSRNLDGANILLDCYEHLQLHQGELE